MDFGKFWEKYGLYVALLFMFVMMWIYTVPWLKTGVGKAIDGVFSPLVTQFGIPFFILIVILSGQLSLRGSQGWRELREGEIVSFPLGEGGAHQIVNRSNEPARMLAFSTSGVPDIVIRPDSGTIGVFERRPEGGGLYSHFRVDDAVSYFDGEQPPKPA